MSPPHLQCEPDGSILLWVKAVPGASRDQIAGVLGDRLKLRVAAPAEDGKANAAACRLLAHSLGIKPANVTLYSGHSNPEKVVRILGMTPDSLRARLCT